MKEWLKLIDIGKVQERSRRETSMNDRSTDVQGQAQNGYTSIPDRQLIAWCEDDVMNVFLMSSWTSLQNNWS